MLKEEEIGFKKKERKIGIYEIIFINRQIMLNENMNIRLILISNVSKRRANTNLICQHKRGHVTSYINLFGLVHLDLFKETTLYITFQLTKQNGKLSTWLTHLAFAINLTIEKEKKRKRKEARKFLIRSIRVCYELLYRYTNTSDEWNVSESKHISSLSSSQDETRNITRDVSKYLIESLIVENFVINRISSFGYISDQVGWKNRRTVSSRVVRSIFANRASRVAKARL